MKVPGPDHPIIVAPTKGRVVVKFGDEVIADSMDAVTLTEASYPGVQYIPRGHARMDLLRRTAQKTHCPYKGEASYYTISGSSGVAINAVWSYEEPFPHMAEIAGRLAFYPDKVQIAVIESSIGERTVAEAIFSDSLDVP